MKRTLLAAFLILLAAAASIAQEESKASARADYSPLVLKAGEKCFVRIKMNDDISLPDDGPLSVDENPWFYITDLKVNYAEDEVLIWFVPLDPSLSFLPAVRAGNKVYSGIPVSVMSRLDEGSVFTFPGGRLLLPGTRLLFAALAAIVILALFTAWYLLARLPGKIRDFIFLKTGESEKKKLLSRMAFLASSPDRYGSAELSGLIASCLKEYLEIITGERVTCFTTSEVIAASGGKLSGELVFFDSVRFGNIRPDTETIKKSAEKIYDYAVSAGSIITGAADGV